MKEDTKKLLLGAGVLAAIGYFLSQQAGATGLAEKGGLGGIPTGGIIPQMGGGAGEGGISIHVDAPEFGIAKEKKPVPTPTPTPEPTPSVPTDWAPTLPEPAPLIEKKKPEEEPITSKITSTGVRILKGFTLPQIFGFKAGMILAKKVSSLFHRPAPVTGVIAAAAKPVRGTKGAVSPPTGYTTWRAYESRITAKEKWAARRTAPSGYASWRAYQSHLQAAKIWSKRKTTA